MGLTATATAASSLGPVRAIHAGIMSVTGSYTGQISATATTVLMCKIPNRATILDVQGIISSGAASSGIDLGKTGSLSAYAGLAVESVISRATKGLPDTLALSDDAANQFVYITATITGSSPTAAAVVSVTVLYSMDGVG